MEVENRTVVIKGFINGHPLESDFELKNSLLIPKVEEGSKDVITKNLYLSIDPYHINRMKEYSPSQEAAGFTNRQEPGQCDLLELKGEKKTANKFLSLKKLMSTSFFVEVILRVVASGNEEFKKDDMVVGLLSWEDYTVVRPGTLLTKIVTKEFPLSYHVGVLGSSGLTAYAGLYDICKPKPGEKVLVSAASGSVGNLVGQFAKLSGCYVVGCAGSQEKVDMLKEKLGFDNAFNYKDEKDMKAALKRYFPEGIDIYFDNVGAEILEAAVANMNTFGRVAVCGAISEYTDGGKRASPSMINVIYKRIMIRGFLVYDHLHVYDDYTTSTQDHLRNGRIQVLEDISQGLESIPSAFIGLFRGDSVGKKLVQLSDI